MYTTAWCGYCVRAKALLDGKGIEYDEINLDDDPQTTVLPVESTSFRRGLELSPLALISSGR